MQLLGSAVHEDRLLGLLIVVEWYKGTSSLGQGEKILQIYLNNRAGINNWDLVDLSAPQILGHACLTSGNSDPILKLSRSSRHWDRRMAMVSTLTFIRQGFLDLSFELAELFLSDKEDLMHKATGWMLRETGKKNRQALLAFLKKNGPLMPRTMLRYAIEHFPEAQRQAFLKRPRLRKP